MRRRAVLVAALLVGATATHAAAILPGGNSKQPISIESAKLDYFDKEQKLVYSGNVVAAQGEAKLKASALTIYLAGKGAAGAAPSSTGQVQRMVVTGPVTVVQRDQIGTGDNAVYDKAQNTVILTGNVTLSQGPNVTKGDKLVYDLRSGQAAVTGRVKSMFLPGSSGTGGGGEAEETPRPHGGRKGADRSGAADSN